MKKPGKLPTRKANVADTGGVPVDRIWTTLVALAIAITPVCLIGLIFGLDFWPWPFLIVVLLFTAVLCGFAWQGWKFVLQLFFWWMWWENSSHDVQDDNIDYDLSEAESRRPHKRKRQWTLLVVPFLVFPTLGTPISALDWWLHSNEPFTAVLHQVPLYLMGAAWFGGVLYVGASLDLLSRSRDAFKVRDVLNQ